MAGFQLLGILAAILWGDSLRGDSYREAEETGLFLRMVHDLRRIHSHLVSFAYPTLQRPRGRPVARVEAALHPWVAYLDIPLFAFANAGVHIQGVGAAATNSASIAWGVALGLIVGEPIGIIFATIVFVRLGWCALPAAVTWRQIGVLGCLGGIGFTMSIFIADLAFPNAAHLAMAKCAVLAASVAAAIGGLILGRLLLPMRELVDDNGASAHPRSLEES